MYIWQVSLWSASTTTSIFVPVAGRSVKQYKREEANTAGFRPALVFTFVLPSLQFYVQEPPYPQGIRSQDPQWMSGTMDGTKPKLYYVFSYTYSL